MKYFKYSDLPKSKHAGVDNKLVIIPFVSFCGYLGASLFFVYYFHFTVRNPGNAVIFGVLSVLLLVFFAAYLRFLRFMERP
jgi:hypothetical protein